MKAGSSTDRLDYLSSELDDASSRLYDVLMFRAYHSDTDSYSFHDKPGLDRIAENELEEFRSDGKLHAEDEIIERAITHSYNTAIRGLKELEDEISEREKVGRDGSVDMFTPTGPKMSDHYSRPRVTGHPAETPRDPRSHYEELKSRAALIGEYLERLTEETDNCDIDPENLEQTPSSWGNAV